MKSIKKMIFATTCIFTLCVCSIFMTNISLITAQTNKGVSPHSLWTTIRNAEILPDISTPDYAKPGTGLGVTNFGSGAEIVYKNAIDISKNTKNDSLLSLHVLTDQYGKANFKQFKVKLTDTQDQNNFIEIVCIQNNWWEFSSFFQVGMPGIDARGLKDGKIASGQIGCEVYIPFTGLAHKGPNSAGEVLNRPFEIRYDAQTKSVYAVDWNNNLNLVLDLDNPLHVGNGNEWKGFSNGLVNVSIQTQDFAAAIGKYIILDLNGTKMSTLNFNDIKAPSLIVSAQEGKLPAAEINKKYSIFSAYAEDETDGKVSDISVDVIDPSGVTTRLKEKYFIPAQIGAYTLIYQSSDSSNNIARKSFTILSSMTTPAIDFQVKGELLQSMQVGQIVALPEVTASGGSGLLTVKTTVYNSLSGQIVPQKTPGYFSVGIEGDFHVTYSAIDYLNNQNTVVLRTKAVLGSSPICSFPILPQNVIAEMQILLPLPEAFDYYTDVLNRQKAKVKIEADYGDGYKEIPLLFTPKSEGVTGSVDIRYTVTGNSAGKSLTKIYKLNIIKPVLISDYFIKNNANVIMHKDSIEISPSADKASVSYILPLNSQQFSLMFDINKNKNNFQSVTIELTDSLDDQLKLSFNIKKRMSSETSFVEFNGTNYQMNGSFEELSKYPFELKYSDKTLTATDFLDIPICKTFIPNLGKVFNGFSSGAVYLKISFSGVGEGGSSLFLKRLMEQSLYAEFGNDGKVLPLKDYTPPKIYVNESIELTKPLGAKVTLPFAKAYDALEYYTPVYLTVASPDGTLLFNKERVTDVIKFTANNYGTYRVIYEASDTSGNSKDESYFITVADNESPKIFVDGRIISSASVGSSFIIPSVIALDNLTVKPICHNYMIEPGQYMKTVNSGESYKFAKKGTYVLRFYAYDNAYNYHMLDYKIVVG